MNRLIIGQSYWFKLSIKLSIQENPNHPIQGIYNQCCRDKRREECRQISAKHRHYCRIGNNSQDNQFGGAYQVPCQDQHPTPVFLRDFERDVPKSGELLHRRHDANLNPYHGDKNPNHALCTIPVDNSVHTIMNGNPIWQRTITTRYPDCNPNEQCATQQVNNPYKQRALHTAVMR